ncbi:unnamed protein product [Lymnaea stagnalis]|uniref:ABC-type glutathione-S-conjugate transporter n=1 Tax=Lymnaea stagnalis TaxID=6523 RepID=A0AAV2HIW8_LYMST
MDKSMYPMDDTVIQFPSVCLDPFWNSTLTLGSSWPRFTHCFLHTALSWPALLTLVIVLPGQILYLKNRSTLSFTSKFQLSRLFVIRGICTTSLAVLTLVELVRHVLDTNEWKTSYVVLISDGMRLFTFLSAQLLMIYERHKGVSSSGPLFVFWTVLALTETLWFHQRIKEEHYANDQTDFIITAVIYSLIVVTFLLGFFADPERVKVEPVGKSSKPQWPELVSSFPSILMYLWITRTVYSAWKRLLAERDIFELPESCKGNNLLPEFDKAWKQVSVPLEKSLSMKSSSKSEERSNRVVSQVNTPERYGNSSYKLHKMHSKEDDTKIGEGSNIDEAESAHSSNEESGNKDATKITQEKSRQQVKTPFSLIKVLLRLHGARYSFGFLIKIIGDTLTVIQPIIIREIIKTVQFGTILRPSWLGVMLSVAFVFSNLLKNITQNASLYVSSKIGLDIKSALTSSIFQKALRMSSEGRKKYTSGEIITMMSVDAQRVQEVCRFIVLIVGAPIQLIASAVLLYYTIGVSVVSGIIVLFLLMPINSVLASKMQKLQAINMKLKSKRVKLTTDVLNGIKVLKLYAWEKSFEEKISQIRNEELKNLKTLAYYRTAMSVNNWTTPYLVTLSTFATYILISEENHLDPATAFVSMTYFSILRSPLIVVTYVISGIVMSVVSLKRINQFLYGDELDTECVGANPKQGSVVSVVQGSFAWDSDGKSILSDVTLDIPEKSLTMIVGKVGCGKSSLLSGILGEMKLLNGSVNLKGSVAYVAQQAWIQNCSVKENILFGSPLDAKRYSDILKACALERDLSILPQGDETEIGEKGINLSGGQKQRVALARAVYSNQDVYLLDDPLSAVDAHVGKHIFEQVIGPDGILKEKTRILVTHGAHWLPYADIVIMLINGKINHFGSFEDLLAQGGDFIEHLKQPEKEDDDDSYLSSEEDDVALSSLNVVPEGKKETYYDSNDGATVSHQIEKSDIPLQRLTSKTSERKIKQNKTDAPQQTSTKLDGGKIIEDEKMQQGKVKLKVILAWISAASVLGMVLYYFILALFQAASAGSSFWIRFWTEDSLLANTSLANTSDYADRNYLYLGVYGAFGAGQIFLFFIGYASFWVCAIRASKILHRNMLKGILRSPMAFFESTPVGRMLNRFSSDTDTLDLGLPLVMVDMLNCLNQVLGTIIIVCLNVPLFATAILPIFLLFFLVLKFYLPTARQLKRMDTVAKSPIYSHFGEALGGASTIRAFGHSQRFLKESREKVDDSVMKSLMLYACSSWLTIMISNLGLIFVFAAMIFAVTSSDVNGAEAGLAISYSVEFSVFLGFLVQQSTELTQHSVSVERILEYIELKPEGQENAKGVSMDWPQKGKIEFKNFQLRYREGLDLVLKGISAVITPGEKIGIVGRTGAGKSTMTLALFRIIESAGGSICIDDTNIADVDLYRLRSSISILPQDPVLFSGSLRMNIDPHNEYSDEEVLKSLERAHLQDFVKCAAGGLTFDVGEEGKNMSVGQRQLVCLARSLLKQNKILVLDEATAAVDIQTDSLIQETIRSAFKDCTILTIAHRINTIMDYDRVLVLDAGEIKEFAPIKELLNNPNSLFYGLAKEANLV